MGLRGYVLFAGGQLGLMVLVRFFFQWLLRFFGGDASEAPLLSAASVGLLLLGFRLFDAVTDPLAGMMADAWTRRGRQRRSLLWFSFALPAIGLVLIFAPMAHMSMPTRWALLSVGMLVFFTGYTLYAIPYWSLIDDYSGGDLARRSRLSNILGAALLVATGVGFVLSPPLVERIGFLPAAVAFALPCAAFMVLPYFAAPPLGKTPARPASERPRAPLWQGVVKALRHRRFLAVMVLFSGSQMSFAVMTAAAAYIADDLLGGTTGDVALLLGPFLLLAVPSFAFVPRVAARFGWERTTTAATLMLGMTYAGTAFLGQGPNPFVAAMLVFACGGPMAAVLLGLEAEAITSCAAERGDDLTSIYFGLFNFVVKGLNGLALFLTGVLADAAVLGNLLAVRGMSWLAGGLLVLGVCGYALLCPRSRPRTP